MNISRQAKLIALTVFLVQTGCIQLNETDTSRSKEFESLTEESSIRVVTCEALVRKVVTQPDVTPVFVSASDVEREALSKLLPNYLVSSIDNMEFVRGSGARDKTTGLFGVVVEIGEPEISGTRGFIRLAYSFESPTGVNGRFEFDLVRRPNWIVTETKHERIVR